LKGQDKPVKGQDEPGTLVTDSIPQSSDHRPLLERIIHSNTFHRSMRLRDLLLDIADHTLAGDTDSLSEQAIGVRIFGRQEGYNPAEDNIVRSSVRQLRFKLKEYFETEGCDEAWTLEIPKGGYVAVFEHRTVQVALPELVRHPPAAKPKGSRLVPVLLAVSGLLLSACSMLGWRAFSSPAGPIENETLFSDLFRQNPGPIHFILTDSALVLMTSFMGHTPSVETYADRSFIEEGSLQARTAFDQSLWTSLQARQITSLADVLILQKVFQACPDASRRIEVRHAKHMQVRGFKSGNFIITGSPISNPWEGLFEPSLNFQYQPGVGIVNRAPVNGEATVFQRDNLHRIDHARIAVVKNLSGNGFVLLIAGVGMEGTEGAGEFLLRNDSLQLIRKSIGLSPREPLSSFELILQIATLDGTARSERIVAWRRH
jgi:hypothetical protein